MNNNTYAPHSANVYKNADGSFQVRCQTRGCRFDIKVNQISGKPADYAEAQREADDHSRYRFR